MSIRRGCIVLVVLVCFLVLTACQKVDLQSSMPSQMPKGFTFVASWGFGGKNVLDTSKGTFTKDLIADGTATTKMRLTDDVIAKIYARMREMNLVQYPNYLTGDPNRYVTPASAYKITLQWSGDRHEVFYDAAHPSTASEAQRFVELIEEIRKAVQATKEYTKMPPAKGGYD